MRNYNGFTLIEVTIVISIITFIAGFGLFFGLDFYRTYSLDSECDTLVSALRRSRVKALDDIDGTSHGLKVGDDNLILFSGNSYVSRNPALDESIGRSFNIAVTGLDEIVFGALSATSSSSSTITLSDGIHQRTISVNYEGRIDW